MDELFLTPPCTVAMPRAYWLLDESPQRPVLASHVMLVQPSAAEFSRITERVETSALDEYDMEILNDVFLDTATVIPHRPYAMLSSEFRRSVIARLDEESQNTSLREDKHPNQIHGAYLGSDTEIWDPIAVYNEAKFVHFSDWPVPKPWIRMNEGERRKYQPDCVKQADGNFDCSERTIWNELYEDFWVRREVSTIAFCVLCPALSSSLFADILSREYVHLEAEAATEYTFPNTLAS
jgi:hypothetical protein